MSEFTGRTVLITGAGGSLGRAAAVTLSGLGADLVLADRDAAALADTGVLCPGAITRCCDVTLGEEVDRLAQDARAAFGRSVYGVVGAAGMLGPMTPLVEISEEDFDRTFALNTRALWLLCRAVVPQMREAGEGAIVLLSSTAGLEASKHLNLYSVTKAAVIMLARNLALNHAAEKIRVNCVCPGTIEGPMTESSIAIPELDAAAQDARREAVVGAHPMKRLGTAQEVAESIVFLLGDRASFTTGVALPVDGGRLA